MVKYVQASGQAYDIDDEDTKVEILQKINSYIPVDARIISVKEYWIKERWPKELTIGVYYETSLNI